MDLIVSCKGCCMCCKIFKIVFTLLILFQVSSASGEYRQIRPESSYQNFGQDLSSEASTPSSYQTPRFILYFGKKTATANSKILSQGQIADFAFQILDESYAKYAKLFDYEPKKKVTLKFLSPEEFKRYTGAPAWTSAMYFNDEITIPLNPNKGINLSDLGRALKHEYAHAVIAEVSDGKCPAWLDEGLAQHLEGKINPLLGPALRKWISTNDAMPLEWLINGFTLLNDDIVPAAYAESLFATKKILAKNGYKSITNYFASLRGNETPENSFKTSFDISINEFTDEMTKEMKVWRVHGGFDP